jgi:hypothetical protein
MHEHRGDIVNSLVHLTREKGDSSALEVLCQILSDGELIGSSKKGFIKGPNSAVCFTETPLSSLKHFATKSNQKEYARYRFYGIALNKEGAFNLGARPVIYLPDNEGDWIPQEQKWRHVRYEYDKVDWTHEREWRKKGNLDLTKLVGIYIICWHSNEIEKIKKSMNKQVAKKVRGFLPMLHLNMML